MNEKTKNKREWVKTAAIVFLSVMLVLTFFSNTIMNYSLPEVATKYVESGTITAKIRGTGTIESGDPYEIVATESRKVLSVKVHPGDKVEKGDVLLYLEDTDSEELKAAKTALEEAEKALKTAQDAYDLSLLAENVTASDINAANSNVSASTYRAQITAKQQEIDAIKATIPGLEKKVADIDLNIKNHAAQIEYEQKRGSTLTATLTEKNTLMQTANSQYTAASAALTAAVAVLTYPLPSGETYPTQADIEAAKNAFSTQGYGDVESFDVTTCSDSSIVAAYNLWLTRKDCYNKKLAFDSAERAKNDATAAYNEAKRACDEANITGVVENLTNAKTNYELELYCAQRDLNAANDNLKQKQDELSKLISTIGNVTQIEEKLEAVSMARENVEKCKAEVEKEEAKVTGATVTASISGTVSSVNVTAGNTFQYKDVLVVLQPEGQGYTLSFSVKNDQARRLSVGDKADLINAWRYDDVEVILASIKPDKSNPGQSKLLTFNVTGDVTAGQTLNVSVGQKSANFDLIVPNSSIREDSNGKFILIVESKPSPLGNRYYANRVDVEVVASDDTQSAISAALYGYEYVITTSTKPVEAGQLVRLANN